MGRGVSKVSPALATVGCTLHTSGFVQYIPPSVGGCIPRTPGQGDRERPCRCESLRTCGFKLVFSRGGRRIQTGCVDNGYNLPAKRTERAILFAGGAAGGDVGGKPKRKSKIKSPRTASQYMWHLSRLGRQGKWREIEPTLADMRSGGLIVDGKPYTTAIKALGDNGKLQQALRVLKDMRNLEQGIKPNEHIYTAAVHACAKRGDWARALVLLQEMQEIDGLFPNQATYAGAVSACARGGNIKGALGLLDEIRNKLGVPPNVYAFNSAIHACARKVKDIQSAYTKCILCSACFEVHALKCIL
ncbi:unnamed protein product [Discosporangium mesarthrocarpum]